MHSFSGSFRSIFKQLRSATCNFLGIAVAGALLLSVFMAPRAAAHDVLVSSDPEDGAEVTEISSLTLTFNNDPLDVNPVITISGPDGQEKALDLDPVVDGRDVYVEFSDLEPGEYAVSWRVVSSDGHPIEGNQSFTLLADTDAEEPGADEPVEDPDTSVSSDEQDEDSSATPPDEDNGVDRIDADDSNSDSPAATGGEAESGAETTSLEIDDQADSSSFSWWIWIVIGVAVAAAIIVFAVRSSKDKERDSNDHSSSSN